MKSTARLIAEYLDAQGIGVLGADVGWTIAYSAEPMSPDTAITVYDTGGSEGEPDIELRRPTVQVRVRSHNYNDAYAKQEEVIALLTGTPTHLIDDTRVIGFWMAGDIISIGKDENNRQLLTCNYRIIKQPNE